ncbi:MAG: L,D-transpeptidase family protein [Pseudomonadota bacterium]
MRNVIGGVVLAATLGLGSPGWAERAVPHPDLTVSGPQSPVAMAVRDALQARLSKSSTAHGAYEDRGYLPIWYSPRGEATPALRALSQTLSQAAAHGLPTDRYALPDAGPATPEEIAAREVTTTLAFVAYARDLTSGLLEPSKVDSDIHVKPPRPVPGELIAGFTAATDRGAWFAALAPQDPAYDALRHRYDMLIALAETEAWGAPVANGRLLREGDRSARIPGLRARLTALGDYRAEDATAPAEEQLVLGPSAVMYDTAMPILAEDDPELYDSALAAAVRRFQARHGLNQDAMIGPATLAQLNADATFRAQQILVNLERMRWTNRPRGERYIAVNLADFQMRLVDGGETRFTSRVVVGKAAKHETPEFSDVMEYMVVNPTWHVPRSIAGKEILPKLQEDPGYLDQKNMTLKGIDPWSVDWHSITPATFPGRVAQKPGDGNALGQVKFMFPNDFSIYLHDTPAKSLFAKDMRAHSHGCVRVEKPVELAQTLLTGQNDDPAAAFEAWVARGKETWVHFDEPWPVHLYYRTAWLDAEGALQFRGDIYDRDARALALMAEAGVEGAQP